MSKILKHPYEGIFGKTPWRGNLHAHTQRSDGRLSPEEVLRGYHEKGYDFLMFSDHDVWSDPTWLAGLDGHGMTLIPGNEISANGCHLLHVHAAGLIAPHPQRQRVLNEIAAEPQSFSVICHPNWLKQFDYATIDQLREWVGYAGIEIYNGVISRLEGSAYATNKWDMLLSQGIPCWGYANDDSHLCEDIGLGWNEVFSESKDCEAIVDALRHGHFYASTGVKITGIAVEGQRVRLTTQNAKRIAVVGDWGKRLIQVDADTIDWEAPETLRYIRFECWGEGEQMAWTQPFFVV